MSKNLELLELSCKLLFGEDIGKDESSLNTILQKFAQ